jgi:hypothetical protein
MKTAGKEANNLKNLEIVLERADSTATPPNTPLQPAAGKRGG